MKVFLKYIIIIFAAGLILAQNADADISVKAQIDSSTDIYVGDTFQYRIVLEGSDNPGEVDLEPLKQFSPQSLGNSQQSSIRIENGRTTQTKTIMMNYSLTAQKEGPMQIPSVTVRVGGKNYKTNPMQITVVKPGSTDKIKLELTLSENRCYIGQPVIMTVKWLILTKVKDVAFNVPVFESNDFYIEDISEDQKAWAQANHQINGIPVTLKEERKNYQGTDAAEVSFTKVLIPKRAGNIEIPPATVSSEVAVGYKRTADTFFGPTYDYKRFMVSSKPVTLTVLPLPEEGKPKGFYGLVGRYTISAQATPTTDIYMGDPITLTIRVGGGKYLAPIQWPLLEKIPGFAENFKIPAQKASPVTENGVKVFTQTIRPDNNQAKEIPPIPLAYFDADRNSYQVVKTEPIKLDLKPSKRLTSADIEGKDFMPVNTEVEAIKKGLSANYYEYSKVMKNMHFSPLDAAFSPGYLAIWGGPLAALIASTLFKLLTHTTPEKQAGRRRRQAKRNAISQLKNILSVDKDQRNETFAAIMKQYVGDRFDRTAGSLTADDCYIIIFNATNDAETAEQFKDIVACCEASRYASVDSVIDQTKLDKAAELVRIIEIKSGKWQK
ncbi:MAG: protein BatD [Candidatus Brocadiia bacterium]|nr:MAG: protein BatD [Candidatus Brocadiia bacterium]